MVLLSKRLCKWRQITHTQNDLKEIVTRAVSLLSGHELHTFFHNLLTRCWACLRVEVGYLHNIP